WGLREAAKHVRILRRDWCTGANLAEVLRQVLGAKPQPIYFVASTEPGACSAAARRSSYCDRRGGCISLQFFGARKICSRLPGIVWRDTVGNPEESIGKLRRNRIVRARRWLLRLLLGSE